MMTRAMKEAAMPMPAFAPVLRELDEGVGVGEAGGGVLDAEVERVLIEEVEDMEEVKDMEEVEEMEEMEEVEDAEDMEDAEDETMLLVKEVEETDVVEPDAFSISRELGEGA